MEAHKTMRKTMALVLMMVVAGCGVEPADGPIDDDDGMELATDGDTGSGSGSGSGSEVDTGCVTASDCGVGNACELSTHTCIGGMRPIAPQPEDIIDGSRVPLRPEGRHDVGARGPVDRR